MRNIATTIFLIFFLFFMLVGGILLVENAVANPATPFVIVFTAIFCAIFFFGGRYLLLKYDPMQQQPKKEQK